MRFLPVCISIAVAAPFSAFCETLASQPYEAAFRTAYVEQVFVAYEMEDLNGDGTVTLEEALTYERQLIEEDLPDVASDPDYLAAMTESYLEDDHNGDGVVTAREFAEGMFDRTLADFISLDTDDNGQISFREFIYRAPGAEAAAGGAVDGTSYRFGATADEVNSPHPYFHKGPFDANFMAYLGHAFARWDKDASFTLSFEEYAH